MTLTLCVLLVVTLIVIKRIIKPDKMVHPLLLPEQKGILRNKNQNQGCHGNNGKLHCRADVKQVTLIVIKRIIKPIMNRTGKANQDYGASMYEWIRRA